jgi:hypothetical protein
LTTPTRQFNRKPKADSSPPFAQNATGFGMTTGLSRAEEKPQVSPAKKRRRDLSYRGNPPFARTRRTGHPRKTRGRGTDPRATPAHGPPTNPKANRKQIPRPPHPSTRKNGAGRGPRLGLGMTADCRARDDGKTRRKSLRSRLRKAQARPELQGKPALREDAKDGAPAQDMGPRHGPTRNTGAWGTHQCNGKSKADSSTAAGKSSANHADDGGLANDNVVARRRGVSQLFFLVYSV